MPLAPTQWHTPSLATSVPPPSLQPRGPLASSPAPVSSVPHGQGSVRARVPQHEAAPASAPGGSLQLVNQATGSSVTAHPVLTQSRQPIPAGPRSAASTVAVNPTPSGQGQPAVKPPHPVPTGSSVCALDNRSPVGTLTE